MILSGKCTNLLTHLVLCPTCPKEMKSRNCHSQQTHQSPTRCLTAVYIHCIQIHSHLEKKGGTLQFLASSNNDDVKFTDSYKSGKVIKVEIRITFV